MKLACNKSPKVEIWNKARLLSRLESRSVTNLFEHLVQRKWKQLRDGDEEELGLELEVMKNPTRKSRRI